MWLVDGHDARERLGQLDHDPVPVPEHRRMRDLAELVGEGGVELRDVVAEGVDPE